MTHGRAARAVFTTALALPLSLAWAGNPPKLKQGLWDIHGQRVESPGDHRSQFTYKLCRDHTFDKAINAQLKDVKGCSTAIKDEGGGKFSSASTCTVSGTTIVSQGMTVYLNDKLTHSETHAAYSPALSGKADEVLTEDQQYVGKCPAAMKPGDTLPPDGIVRHHDKTG